MKITQLLETHHKFSKGDQLVHSLGDGFLYQHNRIFKNIRRAVQRLEYNFVENSNIHYQALPFVQLENILSDKKIPYIDNVTVLESLTQQLSEVRWNDLGGGLKKNYIFHESCHAVARAVCKTNKINNEDQILQTLIEESFANSCELLAMVDVNDQAHRIFYEQNSYTWLPEIKSNLKSCITDFGEKKVLKFMLFAYLHSNFLRNGINEKQTDVIFDLIEVKKSELQKTKLLRSLAKVAFTLDYEFRTVTTGLHLKLRKLNTNLVDFDFMSALLENPNWLVILDGLVKSATEDQS